MFNYQNDSVKIVEVGPRDGLQNEKKILSLVDKTHYIDLLAQTGLRFIEATSFVRKEKIPQMADAETLFQELSRKKYDDSLNFPCLVPNRRGMENAVKVGVKQISLLSATSDQFTQKNINCSIDESFERIEDIIILAKKHKILVRGYVSTVFGCPYAGEIGPKALMNVMERFLKLGIYEISLGDTIGVAQPKQVYDYLKMIKSNFGLDQVAMHFHDTRGLALSNILVSLEMGVRTFDASSGGLGGCPYAKGATGNVATEDLVYLFDKLGLHSGVDMNKLLLASEFILKKVNKVSPSKIFHSLS